MKRVYKERRLYFFECKVCHTKNRTSLKRRKAAEEICRKCKRNQPLEGQQVLFKTEIKGKFKDEPIKREKIKTAVQA